MLRESNPPKEPAAKKAERKWRNNAISKRIKAEQATVQEPLPQEPQIAELIENEARLKGPANNFERRFKREIRAMMEGYSQRNLKLAAIALENQKKRLLREKLRRLEARAKDQEPREATNV